MAVTTLQSMSLFFAPLLAEANLTLKDLDFVQISMPDAVAAYANKSVDAAFQMQPLLSQTLAQGLAVQWKPVSEYMPRLQTGVILASPQFLQNKDVANRWMVAYLKGTRAYIDAVSTGKGIDDVISILAKYTPLKDKDVYQLMLKNGGFYVADPDGRADKESLAGDHMQHYLDEGFIQQIVSADTLVDESLVNYAVQKLGKKT